MLIVIKSSHSVTNIQVNCLRIFLYELVEKQKLELSLNLTNCSIGRVMDFKSQTSDPKVNGLKLEWGFPCGRKNPLHPFYQRGKSQVSYKNGLVQVEIQKSPPPPHLRVFCLQIYICN